jgi:hypothetical protein
VLGATPPNADLVELLPKAPNPLGAGLGDFPGEAKLDSLGAATAAPNGEGDFEPEAPMAPNGEAEEAAKVPKPEDLNFSSLV